MHMSSPLSKFFFTKLLNYIYQKYYMLQRLQLIWLFQYFYQVHYVWYKEYFDIRTSFSDGEVEVIDKLRITTTVCLAFDTTLVLFNLHQDTNYVSENDESTEFSYFNLYSCYAVVPWRLMLKPSPTKLIVPQEVAKYNIYYTFYLFLSPASFNLKVNTKSLIMILMMSGVSMSSLPPFIFPYCIIQTK